jgi:ATP-binding cassette subfamily B protein
MMGFRRDDALAQRRIDRKVMRRVFGYIRPYMRQLVLFIATVIAGSIATAVSPLLLKSLLDTAIPHRDRTLVMWIALGAVALALANGVLSLVQRYYSARIG